MKETEVRQEIPIHDYSDVQLAGVSSRQMATGLGLKSVDKTLIATVVCELATNIIRYAGKGTITLYHDEKTIHILATDSGPGINDIDQALQEGYSSGNGLGVGLPGVKRMMDEMIISSEKGQGTCVHVSKKLK